MATPLAAAVANSSVAALVGNASAFLQRCCVDQCSGGEHWQLPMLQGLLRAARFMSGRYLGGTIACGQK